MKKIKNYLKSLLSHYYCSREEYYNLQNLDAEIHDVILINSNRIWAISVVCRTFYFDENKAQVMEYFAFLSVVILLLILGPKLTHKVLT